jgi:hypothetical protein
LGPEADETAAAEMAAFDTVLDKEILSEKIARLRSLEWKYLRRTS